MGEVIKFPGNEAYLKKTRKTLLSEEGAFIMREATDDKVEITTINTAGEVWVSYPEGNDCIVPKGLVYIQVAGETEEDIQRCWDRASKLNVFVARLDVFRSCQKLDRLGYCG